MEDERMAGAWIVEMVIAGLAVLLDGDAPEIGVRRADKTMTRLVLPVCLRIKGANI